MHLLHQMCSSQRRLKGILKWTINAVMTISLAYCAPFLGINNTTLLARHGPRFHWVRENLDCRGGGNSCSGFYRRKRCRMGVVHTKGAMWFQALADHILASLHVTGGLSAFWAKHVGAGQDIVSAGLADLAPESAILCGC